MRGKAVAMLLGGLVVGWALFKDRRGRGAAPAYQGSPTELGELASVETLGDQVVVRVYFYQQAYSAYVYWRGRFLGMMTGFGSVGDAVGWGRDLARASGAAV